MFPPYLQDHGYTKDFAKQRYCTSYKSLVPRKGKFKMNLTINTRWRNSISNVISCDILIKKLQ